MPLLKCIDCGNDVSSYAKICPHCGCPVSVIAENLNVNKLYGIEITSLPEKRGGISGFVCQTYDAQRSEAIYMIMQTPFVIVDGMTNETARTLKDLFDKEGCESTIFESRETVEKFTDQDLKSKNLFQKYQPIKCPCCGSSAVTTGSRGYSLVWGFIGSNKTVNRCGKCGHTWNP